MDKNWSASAYVTAGLTAFAGWINLERAAVLIGIATALGTFVLNWYYKHREHRMLVKRYGDDS